MRYPLERSPDRPLRIAFLSMFADRGGVISQFPRLIIDSLQRLSGEREIALIAWRFHDAEFLGELEARGVRTVVPHAYDPAALLDAVEAAIAELEPEILISDMNNGLPTAVFPRRSAPTQVFLQLGLPAFPDLGLDAVFDGSTSAPRGRAGAQRGSFH